MSELLFSYSSKNKRNGKTLILDLDETLVHSYENAHFLETYGIYSDPTVYRKFHPVGSPQIAYSMLLDVNGSQNRIWGLHRPYLYEFLSFCSDYFDNILVWSAAIDIYVKEITRQIFLEAGLRPPRLSWSRDKCSNYRGLYHKPISDIDAELKNRPYVTFTIDPKKTLILDDKHHTFMMNLDNGVLVPCFHPGKNRPDKIPTLDDLLDRSDNALMQFKQWLQRPEVQNAEDVRLLDKTNIFHS